MRQLLALVLVLCLASPAYAQDSKPEGDGLFALMERMLRDFLAEAEPQLRQLDRSLSELEPELDKLFDKMRDLTQFHPPEMLPNGDILIRRRQSEDDADPEATPAPDDPPGPARPEADPEPFEL